MSNSQIYTVLALVGFVGFMILFVKGINWVAFKLCNWRNVAARYPVQPFSRAIMAFRGVSGRVGQVQARGSFRVELSQEGLKITPGFARKWPIFVPWSRVSSLEDEGFSVRVRLHPADEISLKLPREALETLRNFCRDASEVSA